MLLHSKYRLGVQYGLITGVIYILLLFVRYRFTDLNPNYIGVIAIISYVVILLMYLITGIKRKKQLGGTGEMKEIIVPGKIWSSGPN